MKKNSHFIKVSNICYYFNSEGIVCGKAEGNYIVLHLTDNRTLKVHIGMTEFLAGMGNPPELFRSHRSSFVNLVHVTGLDEANGQVMMNNKMLLCIAEQNYAAFHQAMNCSEI